MSSVIFDSMEQILDRFDEAWGSPTPPRIEDYLAACNPDHRLALLIELVRIDLERRLAAGERLRLEEAYLRRFPELCADPSAIVTLVKHEFALRRRKEPGLKPEEYLERFPQCQTELLAQMPTLDEDRDDLRQQQEAEVTLPAAEPTDLDLRSYELIEALGKGGMGEVYRCCDPALGRDLAIKVMNVDLLGHPEVERRFVREARVTGSLQHPGIVPVHNLGRLSDGRLHYTMRLVRGRTFAAILKEEAGKPERLPYLLTIFEKICQAVAYTHSKRVIHRDLKPLNVMVGRFGEVQVMDWGLAKLLTAADQPAAAEQPPDHSGTRIHTEEEDTPPELTRMGRQMGTPAYMPPEQALGEWDMVDERADVFALGSILCEMLTGQPAYSGTDSKEVYRRAKRGDVAEALERLQQCGADAALTALCRECLSPQREDRPRDAAAVANRVAEHQADVQARLHRAELERAAAVVKAQGERQRRRWILAASLFLLAGVVGATWQAERAIKAEGRARESEGWALEAAQAELSAKRQAEQAAESERRAKELAQNRLRGIEKVNDVLTSFSRELDPRSYGNAGLRLRQQLSQHLARLAAELDKTSVGDPVGVARLIATVGGSLRHLNQAELALKILPKALKTLEEQLGPDHPDTLMARHNLYSAYLYVNRQDEAIPQLEKNLELRKSKLGLHHPDTLLSANNLATAYAQAGRIDDSIRLNEQTLKLQETKLGVDHPHTFKTRHNLAAGYLQTGRKADVIRLLEPYLDKLEAKLGDDDEYIVGYRMLLASACQQTGRIGDAIRLSERNVNWSEIKLGPDDTQTLLTRERLASAYGKAGRTAEAIRQHELNLKVREDNLGADNTRTVYWRNNLADAYLSAGRTAEAIRLYEQNLKLEEANPSLDDFYTLSTQAGLGMGYRQAGRLKDAIAVLEKALDRGRKRSGGLPNAISWLPGVLAETYEQAGQFAKAEAISRDFLEQARQRFGSEDPRTAGQMAALGSNLLRQHKYSDAEPLLRECLKVREAKQPDDWATFNTRSLLGGVLLGQKRYAEAEPLLLQGYEGMKAREAKIPPQGKVRLTEALERLVQLYEAMNKKDEAAKYRKLLEERNAALKKPKS